MFALTSHRPAEAGEALLEYGATGRLVAPAPAVADPFAHPDALRRIRLIADQGRLERALAVPWTKWVVFLHPSQRALVGRSFSGPACVAGSAGTGKIIAALHRAVRLTRENPNVRVLLASFSQPLADAMAKQLLVLAPATGGAVPRITTASFHRIAGQMFQLEHGVRPRLASGDVGQRIFQLTEGVCRSMSVWPTLPTKPRLDNVCEAERRLFRSGRRHSMTSWCVSGQMSAMG